MASNMLTPVQLAEIRERVPANLPKPHLWWQRDLLALLAALDAANAENERMRKALEQFATCELNSDNCASLKVATNRIRSIARAALKGTP